MPPSYHNSPYLARERTSILNRVIATLPSGLGVRIQSMLDRNNHTDATTGASRLPRSLRQAQRAFSIRKLLSLPHLLAAIWLVVLLWGERWVFQNSIAECDWDKWERWPAGTTPHHLVFIADPQLIDPHSYPDRPWPLSTLTILHTDNYIKRSYMQLSKVLVPDTLFFLGDLFDGGREWKTAHGNSEDPSWTKGLRPQEEQKWLKTWRRNYGEKFWLKEYDRFGRIFFKYWNLGTREAGLGQRGRRIIASLPGNHDLGFGAQVKIPIRNRFETYFGQGNRVDVIANHTFVSIDSVSLSAGSSDRPKSETEDITRPVEEFLSGIQATKRKAVARELRYQAGDQKEIQLPHVVEDITENTKFNKLPSSDPGEGAADFPTILLTHVPLYRNPDTPCGPKREHGTSISISRGYQYQNVLSEDDSVKVVSSIGNVVSVFSGDDHDYCELVHPPNKNGALEITVKAFNYAMGIRRPGFLMLSMWNPVTPDGRSKGSMHTGHGSADARGSPTFESHLCLLPDQLGILIRYGIFLAVTIILLLSKAILTPVFKLEPFASPGQSVDYEASVLPTSNKEVAWEEDRSPHRWSNSSTSSTASNPAKLAPRSSAARTRSVSPASGYVLPPPQARPIGTPLIDSAGYYGNRKDNEPPRIRTTIYNKVPKKPDTALDVIGREAYHTIFRTAWMVGGVYLWLVWFG
ncbi:calcineurin-like phosphoesterase [Phlyctema vagabunda]|uniref:Calcineurin-like phosphoesterase n=1 Tax=Phlyctema vagabunda TaxID=108571 RepID=A0ABR4PJG7_9HELO